jgi:hypothetical protein
MQTENGAPLHAELEGIVKGRLNGRVQAFQLIMAGAGLVLRGKAGSYHAKQLAQHLVMEATSVPILANDIQVSDGSAK